MILYGDGRIALAGDRATAEMLGWAPRQRSAGEPEAVLHPRHGDPTSEPWITPPGWAGGAGAAGIALRRKGDGRWHYQLGVHGVIRDLARLSRPRPVAWRVAVAGLGRVGGTAAAAMATVPTGRSGIAELILCDADGANLERCYLELQSVAQWRGRAGLPRVTKAGLDEVFRRCDAFVFAATTSVPPLGTEGDVRHVQFGPNREILRPYLAQARRDEFDGLFLMVSDPVEILALAAFHDSNDDHGRFTGAGLAPERIAGLALGVMWGRALAEARRAGWDYVAKRGAAFGPHSAEVVVFDDIGHPDEARSAALSAAAREGNFDLRRMGFLPYVGPALSSIALTLPRLLRGHEALASVFLAGVYFGAPAKLDWGIFPVVRRLGAGVQRTLDGVHASLLERARSAGVAPAQAGRSLEWGPHRG